MALEVGIGGSVDGPNFGPAIDVADTTQTSGATLNKRVDLGIQKDSLDLTFTQVTGGKINIYNAQADQPTMAPLVDTTPGLAKAMDQSAADVDREVNEMIAKLPPKLRAEITKNNALPEEERNLELTAFTNVLRNTAEISLWARAVNTSQESSAELVPMGQPARANTLSSEAPEMRETTTTDEVFASSVGPPVITGGQAFDNGLKVVSNLESNMKAELGRIPPNDPNYVVLASYLQVLGRLIQSAKELLAEMQQSDAERSKADSVAQREATAAKLKKELEAFDKAMKSKAKQAKVGLVMKICGPIVGAMSLLAVVATGGAAAILIAAAFFALTTADSATGFMSKGIQSLMGAMADKMGGEVGATIMMALMIIVVIAATKGAAGKDIGGLVAKKMGEEGAKAALKNISTVVALQVGMQLMTTSGVVTNTAKGISQLMPIDKDKQQILAAILEMILLLTVMLACGKALGTSGMQTSHLAAAADVVGDSLNAGTKIYSGVSHIKLGFLAKEKADIQAMITQLETGLELLGMDKQNIRASTKQLADLMASWSQLFTKIVQKEVQINSALARAT